jgi:putative ABC transport system permease protein
MLRNYLIITWKVLKRRRVYTFVTMAGIIIPVTFIVLVTSFLVHINNYIPPKSGFKNVIFLDNLTWKEIKEDGSVNQRVGNPPTYSFIEKYVKTLRSPILVSATSNDLFHGTDIIYRNNKPYEVSIKYTDSEFWDITDFRFIDGRPYNKSEFNLGTRVAVIDVKTSESLFGTKNASGFSMEIKNKNYRIAGVVESVDKTMFRLAANIYIPFSSLDNFNSTHMYANFSRALLLADDPYDFQRIEDEFQQKLKTVSFENMGNLNHIEATLKQDNYLQRIEDLALVFFRYYGDIKRPVYAVGGILIFFFIILPAINLVNININRVYERLSEIGVRKTFGASKKKLIAQFLFENIIIIFAGGILSILFSGLIIMVLNHTDALSGIYLNINIKSFLISLMSIFILSILSGLLPSVSMARIGIIESLTGSESK